MPFPPALELCTGRGGTDFPEVQRGFPHLAGQRAIEEDGVASGSPGSRLHPEAQLQAQRGCQASTPSSISPLRLPLALALLAGHPAALVGPGRLREAPGPPAQTAGEEHVRGEAFRGQRDQSRVRPWAWSEGSPEAKAGEQEAIAPPRLLPHCRYQAQKPRKGELGLFLFCSQPLPVSGLGAAARLTPPCPHPRPRPGRPFRREPAPRPPPPSWLRWSLTPPAPAPRTRRRTLPRTPCPPGESPVPAAR